MSTPVSAEPQPLSDRELAAWRGLLRTHAMLVKRLDAELEEAHGLALTSYEVLLHVALADGGRMRMCDIAESVLLSRSGLTRLVDRLERDELVERVSCADDARGAYAQLTPRGEAKLREARTTHLDGVRRHFLGHLAPEQQELLADAWEKVGTSGAPGGSCSVDD